MTDPVQQDPTPEAGAAPAANDAGAETATPAAFEDLAGTAASASPAAGQAGTAAPLDTLMDIGVDVTIQFGRARKTVQEVLKLGQGSIIQLDRMVGEPIDIYVSDRKFGEGEIVVVGDHFGVRISKVSAPVAVGTA